MDNNIIDKRNWRTGYFIKSSKTAHWPQRQIDLTNEDENRIVFDNFKEEDKGRSRKRICICENKEDAAFIVKACNEYEGLNTKIKNMENYYYAVTDNWRERCDKLKDQNRLLLEAMTGLIQDIEHYSKINITPSYTAINRAKEAINKCNTL